MGSLLANILRHPRGRLGLLLLVAILVATVYGIAGPPARLFKQEVAQPSLQPSQVHLLGTDPLGRDVLCRILHGAHLTLGTGLLAVLVAALLGIPVGMIAGYRGGILDSMFMRTADLFISMPPILLAMAIMAGTGFRLSNLIGALGVLHAPGLARAARAATRNIAENDFVAAARALGCTAPRILLRHVFPNIASPLLALATSLLSATILEAATLSFLGLGAQAPQPEWGRMLLDGRDAFLTRPHLMMAPGAAIALAVLTFTLLGDALRDALHSSEFQKSS